MYYPVVATSDAKFTTELYAGIHGFNLSQSGSKSKKGKKKGAASKENEAPPTNGVVAPENPAPVEKPASPNAKLTNEEVDVAGNLEKMIQRKMGVGKGKPKSPAAAPQPKVYDYE